MLYLCFFLLNFCFIEEHNLRGLKGKRKVKHKRQEKFKVPERDGHGFRDDAARCSVTGEVSRKVERWHGATTSQSSQVGRKGEEFIFRCFSVWLGSKSFPEGPASQHF